MRSSAIVMKIITLFILFSLMNACSSIQERKQYSMYVWDNGFDPYVEGCDEAAFLDPENHPECFTNNWNTPDKRQYLWRSCNVEGREISSIFLSGIPGLKYAKENDECETDAIKMVRETLREGHSEVKSLF